MNQINEHSFISITTFFLSGAIFFGVKNSLFLKFFTLFFFLFWNDGAESFPFHLYWPFEALWMDSAEKINVWSLDGIDHVSAIR